MVDSIQYRLLATFVGALIAYPVSAQSARLPISQGIWVKTDAACNSATNVYIYRGNRFGSVYFYGPNQSMGPANETEVISQVASGKNGFAVLNEGPIEVAARLNGQAVVRANSPSQGVQWTDTVRLCEPGAISAKLRAGLTRLGLIGP
jgi:hypothetical protein